MYRSLAQSTRTGNGRLFRAIRQQNQTIRAVPRPSSFSTATSTTGSTYSKEFVSASHPTSPLNSYNQRLVGALRKGSFQDALQQILTISKEIKQQNIKFDAVTYNTLLIAYTRARQPENALKTLSEMISDGLKPTIESYNIVLEALAARNGIESQNKVVDMMEQQQVPLTALSYQHLIKGLRMNDEIKAVLHMFETMKNKGIEPTLRTFGDAITCCVNTNEPTSAYSLMKDAESLNLPLETDPRLLINVLRVSALNDQIEQTQYCWDKVVTTHGLRPDEGSCLQVLRVAAKSGNSKLATEVIRQLSNNGYPYKEHYFIPLMEAFVVKDDLKSAFDVLDIMRVSGVPPSMQSTLSISKKISQNVDLVDKAYYLLEEIKKENKTVDVTAFNIVVAACGLAKDIGRTVATYREASNLGVVPDVDTFNAVLEACIQTEMKGMGQIVIEELKKANIDPNVHTFSKMITLVCTQSNYEDAFVYLEEMKTHGINPPRHCYVVLAKKLARERDPRFHIALEEMETFGYMPDAALKSLWNN